MYLASIFSRIQNVHENYIYHYGQSLRITLKQLCLLENPLVAKKSSFFFSFSSLANMTTRLFKIVGILIVPCLGDFSLFHKNMEREYSKEYVAVISTILSSRSLTCSSASVTLLLIHSSVLFIPVSSFVLLGLWKTFIASSAFFPRDPESSSLSLF